MNSQWEDVSSLWLDSALVHVRCLSRKFVTSMLTEEYMARPERNLQNHRDLVNTKRKLVNCGSRWSLNNEILSERRKLPTLGRLKAKKRHHSQVDRSTPRL